MKQFASLAPPDISRARVLELGKMDAKQILKEKKFWFASALIAWAAALQGHMMWIQRQDAFKEKFRNLEEADTVGGGNTSSANS